MTELHVAQLNVARARGPMTGPVMAGFVALLEEINALAERSPGFVWRLQDEHGDATQIHAFGDPLVIVNLTVWESIDDLFRFAYRSDHVDVFRRRREWFVPYGGPNLVLWLIPSGSIPSIEEARDRLVHLAERGPTVHAFTLKARFDGPARDPLAAVPE